MKFFLSLFIYFKRERERERESTCARMGEGQRERERGRERLPSRLCAVSAEHNMGLEPANSEIMS